MVGSRVLVVEDDHFIAMALKDCLEDLGYRVVGPFADLTAAVSAARSESIDLALLDITIVGASVYPVADELAARGIPFAFATGVDTASLPSPYQDRLALPKPYTSLAIEQAAAALLSRG